MAVPADWLTYRQALDTVRSRVRPLPEESVPLHQALGRALAAPLISPLTLPAADNSAMDGYAVRWSEVTHASPESPVVLDVVGDLRAGGELPITALEPGKALRIATGSPVPPGTSGVVRVEDTRARGSRVEILRAQGKPANVRPRGEDVEEGQTVLPAGTRVHQGVVALASALGVPTLQVHRAPSVALISTGSELVGPDALDEVRRGVAVLDSNGPGLEAAVVEAGATLHGRERVGDSLPLLKNAILRARGADVLVLTGGASVGPADLVKPALDELGMVRDFWRIRMRPGSPVYFGSLEGQVVFGLPGNPTSAHVTFEVLVRPFLRSLAGHSFAYRLRIPVEAGEALRGGKELDHFVRVVLQGDPETPGAPLKAHPAGRQGSGLLLPLARAQGLAHIPPHRSVIAQGEMVDVLLLDTSGPLPDPGEAR